MAAGPAITAQPSQTHSFSVQRDLTELAIGFGLIMATVWTANPTQRVLFWITLIWFVATTWIRHQGWQKLGLSRNGILSSLWIVGVALLLTALASSVAARMHTLHRLHGPSPLLSHVWGYVIWAVMQQFLLQSYFVPRLSGALPGKAAPIVVASSLFALAHLPNPILTPLTLVWGIIACALFLRYRNIYTLGLAHGILGLCVAVTVPNSIHHHMRVGLGYLRYHPSQRDRLLGSYRSHIDQSVSTEACVIAEAPTRRS